MSEAHEQAKKPDSGRAIVVGAGFACLGVFLSGVAKILWANESSGTINLVLAVLEMIFGGIGAACIGRVLFAKHR
jgi:hypothetical protein